MDWEIKLQFEPLEGKYGEAEIMAAYRQAIIRLNPNSRIKFRTDTPMYVLCHEFAHVWLWDLHESKIYDDNPSYNRLVESKIESVGELLYERVLKPLGF